jgi:hypothetical protein
MHIMILYKVETSCHIPSCVLTLMAKGIQLKLLQAGFATKYYGCGLISGYPPGNRARQDPSPQIREDWVITTQPGIQL